MNTVGRIFIPVTFGLLYAWDVWEALGNLVGLGPFYEAFGIADQIPWVLLWSGVLVPFIVFVLAVWLQGKSQRVLQRVVIFTLGWALIAAVTLSIQSIEQAWRASALQSVLG
jgi:hypothetical protein